MAAARGSTGSHERDEEDRNNRKIDGRAMPHATHSLHIGPRPPAQQPQEGKGSDSKYHTQGQLVHGDSGSRNHQHDESSHNPGEALPQSDAAGADNPSQAHWYQQKVGIARDLDDEREHCSRCVLPSR